MRDTTSAVRAGSLNALCLLQIALWGCSSGPAPRPDHTRISCSSTNEEFAEKSIRSYEQFKRHNNAALRASRERIRELEAEETRLSMSPPAALIWEEGDSYPSVRLPGQSTFRLTPVMRRHALDTIERVAINHNSTRIALIARRPAASAHVLLVIDPKTAAADKIEVNAHDVSWIDDATILISELIDKEPRVVLALRIGDRPREIVRANDPAEHLLLRPSTGPGYGLIEHTHPLWSFFEVVGSSDPFKPRALTRRDLPGSSCAIMEDSAFCSSFTEYPQGVITRLNLNRPGSPETIYTESSKAAIADVTQTTDGLAVFTSHGTYSAVSVISSKGRLIRGPMIHNSTTTLSPAPPYIRRSGPEIVLRSFLTPTTYASISQLTGSSQQSSSPLCESCSERALNATSSDGTIVPISLVTPENPEGLLVKVYGSYGVGLCAEYSSEVTSLVRQGIAVAIAHVRGGGELGPLWHTSARGANKLRSVEDLSASIAELQRSLRLPSGRIILYGRSAGAWLVAKTALLYPQTIGGAILEAPLVALEHTVPNQTLPLFERERHEWSESVVTLRALSPTLPTHELSFDLLASVPLRDELVPPHDTLLWLREFRCHQSPSAETIVSLLPGAYHSGPSAKSEIDEWIAAKAVFIRQVIEKNR